MKKLLRNLLLNAFAVYLADYYIAGVSISGNYLRSIAIITITLYVFNTLVKPVINVFLIPINLLTLGTFRWIINILAIFALTILIHNFIIDPFFFPGAGLFGIQVPSLMVGKILAVIITSIFISLVIGLGTWLID